MQTIQAASESIAPGAEEPAGNGAGTGAKKSLPPALAARLAKRGIVAAVRSAYLIHSYSSLC